MYSSYETMICSTSRELTTIGALVSFLFWYGSISTICVDIIPQELMIVNILMLIYGNLFDIQLYFLQTGYVVK